MNEAVMPPPLAGAWYLDFLSVLNAHLAPQSYLEIGTHSGDSLARITCDAIAIDPEFRIASNPAGQRRRTFLFQMTSDAFFREHSVRAFFPGGVDLAFLDGMHRFEFLLRDFINTEAAAHHRSLILLHDCLPRNARMARRLFELGSAEDGDLAGAWTGDIWKLLPILQEYRPDLSVMPLDCPPTGLIAIMRLDPASNVLNRHYHEILARFRAETIESFGLVRLWSLYPLVDSLPLFQNPHDLTAAFGVY